MTDTHIAYFSLGSNLGDKEHNIQEALRMMQEQIGCLLRQSALHVTEPWGYHSDNSFINACACYKTSLSPFQILTVTQDIERKMGRTCKSSRGQYHDRIIDIDILLYDNISLHTDELTIPHPLMQERDFVMKPLSEILPPHSDSE